MFQDVSSHSQPHKSRMANSSSHCVGHSLGILFSEASCPQVPFWCGVASTCLRNADRCTESQRRPYTRQKPQLVPCSLGLNLCADTFLQDAVGGAGHSRAGLRCAGSHGHSPCTTCPLSHGAQVVHSSHWLNWINIAFTLVGEQLKHK